MMKGVINIMILSLLLGATPVSSAEKKQQDKQTEINPEDLKVIAEMENLKLMDLVEHMDILEDINYFVEDEQDENKTN
jgi:hypothetical protein